MTRRSPILPRPARRRRSTSPTRRAATGKLFTRLGFAFFRLVSSNDQEAGAPSFAVVRMRVPRASMAAFVAMTMNAGAI
jgi:hypothetical protein